MATDIVGPCSVRQSMYMFPEEYAVTVDGKRYKEQIDVTLYGGAAGCFDSDTEYLTPDGWKKFGDGYKGGAVGVYCPDYDWVNFETPEEYIELPCDYFKRVLTSELDMALSPEHTVVYWEHQNSSPKKIKFSTLCKEIESGWKGFIKVGSLVNEGDNKFSEKGVKSDQLGNDFTELSLESDGFSMEEYKSKDGLKYCFTVSTGMLVARRSGKVFITGNSGKSEIGVIDFLKWTDTPNFIGVMTRRTTPQMTGPGGLLTKCQRVFAKAYSPDQYTWRAKDGKFVFHHSGAEIYLKHFENDAADVNWQGAEANLFYVDEGTQFTQHQIQYIMSRMRNPSCPSVKPHLKITCNPDADHFLLDWVLPYLKEDGTPDRKKDGMVRFFTFHDGDFVWSDTREGLSEEFGIKPEEAISFCFISANVYDNPIVQEINPQYVSWLKGLRGVERDRLLLGNWLVREKGSSFFDRAWCEEIPYIDEKDVVSTVRAFDFAGTLKSDRSPNPDYTASVRMRLMKNGDYVIDDVRKHRILVGQWQEFVATTTDIDPSNTIYLIPRDPNPAAKRMADMFVRDLILETGRSFKKIDTNKSKLDRFRPFSSMAQNGGIKFVKNCGTDFENGIVNELGFVYRELEVFDGTRKRTEEAHDDHQIG